MTKSRTEGHPAFFAATNPAISNIERATEVLATDLEHRAIRSVRLEPDVRDFSHELPTHLEGFQYTPDPFGLFMDEL